MGETIAFGRTSSLSQDGSMALQAPFIKWLGVGYIPESHVYLIYIDRNVQYGRTFTLDFMVYSEGECKEIAHVLLDADHWDEKPES
jgi:hypothetical protein